MYCSYNRSYRTLSYSINGRHLGVAAAVTFDNSNGAGSSGGAASKHKTEMALIIGFDKEPNVSVTANFGETPFELNLDDLIIEEENRNNPRLGNKTDEREPFRFVEKAYPIHLAACSASMPVLEKLLSEGAVPDQLDDFGWTALHYAACEGW